MTIIIFLWVSFNSSVCLMRTNEFAQVRKMEEEQEEMGNSLMALTSHYAKVQLRLQQVVAAPNEAREELLKDLEDFAFRGIPNMRPPDMDNKALCLVKVNTYIESTVS